MMNMTYEELIAQGERERFEKVHCVTRNEKALICKLSFGEPYGKTIQEMFDRELALLVKIGFDLNAPFTSWLELHHAPGCRTYVQFNEHLPKQIPRIIENQPFQW